MKQEFNLTESDKRNLSECPEGVWFDAMDVWPRVKRPDYSLGRLVERGKLRSRVVTSKNLSTKREYFKLTP